MSALDKLIEAVDAGCATEFQFHTWRPGLTGTIKESKTMWRAYNGSLDAALALHKALLPEKFCPSIDAILRPSGAVEWRAIIHEQGVFYPAKPLRFSVECGHDVTWNNAARAWLLAILRAYRSQVQP